MNTFKRIRSNMSLNVIGGLVFLLSLFGFIVCVIGNNCIVDAFKSAYPRVTYRMADSATIFVNGDHIEQYLAGEEQQEYATSKEELDVICKKLNVSLIYVIKVDTSDYGRFVSVFNSVNNSVDNSEYVEWELGHKRDTTNDEYRQKYKAIYEKGAAYETVFRMHPNDGSHPHITTMVPVKNSSGEVTSILCVQRPVREMASTFMPYVRQIIIGVFFMGIIVSFLAATFLRKSVIEPVETVSAEAMRFAKEHVKGIPLDEVSRYDVMLNLTKSINKMEEDMENYINDLTKATAERERMDAELSIAATIQNDALPEVFPPFPHRHEFDVYALMNPAKEVGGDFYNFFLIDEDHLGLVIADVAGKGVPAALFMMVNNILITELTKMGGKPSEILEIVNERICEHNRADMFVTVWLGILEISTGHMIAANAGHEMPAIYRKDGEFELVKTKHSFVVGALEGVRYKDYELQFNEGDKLFLYTDGVPEATNSEDCLYGTNRMIIALNEHKEKSPQGIIEGVRASVNDFVGEAPQFDDLTMLCMELKER